MLNNSPNMPKINRGLRGHLLDMTNLQVHVKYEDLCHCDKLFSRNLTETTMTFKITLILTFVLVIQKLIVVIF